MTNPPQRWDLYNKYNNDQRNHKKNVVERFDLQINSIPEEASSDESLEEDEQLWDSYSNKMRSTQLSPVASSQWSYHEQTLPDCDDFHSNYTGLLASLVREEGNIYSLAAKGDFLYTGSDSKNIRVWKNQKEFCGFKSASGLIKAIAIADDHKLVFTGHRDGKIRVWKISAKNPSVHMKIVTLPSLRSMIRKSIKPKNYVEIRKNRTTLWIKHFDVISSLSLNKDHSLLYSGSWDKTIKVWKVSNFKCLESISAHDDAVNTIVNGFKDDLVLSGSADGVLKVWKNEISGKRTKHSLVHTLLDQDAAVTSLVICPFDRLVYAGSSDGLINFWEKQDKLLFSSGRVLKCHKLAILCLATYGNLVFSGSTDTNICVWRRDDETFDHKCMYVLRGHSGPVKCLAIDMSRCNENGSLTLYSGSLDRSVNIWRVCMQTDEQQVQMPTTKQKGRLWQTWNGRFQSFTSLGRLKQLGK